MKKQPVTRGLLFVLLIAMTFNFIACEPNIKLTIINKTDTNLNVIVYMNSPTSHAYNLGFLAPDKTIRYTFETSWPALSYVYVLAKNSNGEVILYHQFTDYEVRELGDKITLVNEPFWLGQPPWLK